MNFIVRKAEARDSRDMYEAHQRSIREICSNEYTPEQIHAWAGFEYSPTHWPETIQKDSVWVIEINGKAHGFGHFTQQNMIEGEVSGLYFSPDAKGLGAGRIIIEKMLNFAKERGLEKVKLSSTKTSKNFYKRMGFVEVVGCSFLNIRGQKVDCIPMEMNLKI